MEQGQQFPTGSYNQRTNQPENTGLPPIQTNPQQFSGPNPEEQRKKRMIYTFIQIISVVFLIISFPLIVVALIEIGPQFGKTVESTATVSDITTDLGGVIDQSTGLTDLSSGCRVFYDFMVDGASHTGSAHTDKLCSAAVGSPVEIVHNPTAPSDSTIARDWAPYDAYLTVGIALLVFSMVNIIIFSIMKRKVPKPIKYNQQNMPPGGNY